MTRVGLRPWLVLGLRSHVSRAAKKVATDATTAAKVEPSAVETNKIRSRAISMLPSFMRSYTNKIASAPLSHITSFLIVHELSAIIPLFGVWAGLYYMDWVPLGIPDWVVEKGSAFIRRMAERQNWPFIANAESGSRIVLQGAAAYAVVKALLPLRLVFSLWAMPGFARYCVIPITSRVSKLFKKK